MVKTDEKVLTPFIVFVVQQQQQYLFAIGGWKPEGHKPIRAGSKKK